MDAARLEQPATPQRGPVRRGTDGSGLSPPQKRRLRLQRTAVRKSLVFSGGLKDSLRHDGLLAAPCGGGPPRAGLACCDAAVQTEEAFVGVFDAAPGTWAPSPVFHWNVSAEPFLPEADSAVYTDELPACELDALRAGIPSEFKKEEELKEELPEEGAAQFSKELGFFAGRVVEPLASAEPAPSSPPLDARSMTEHPKWSDFDLFFSRLHSNVRYELTLDNFKNYLGEFGSADPFDAISAGSFEADALLDSPFCQIDECIMRSCVWGLREGAYFGERPGDDPMVMVARGRFVLSQLVPNLGGPGGSGSSGSKGAAAILERSIGLAFRFFRRQLPDQRSTRLKEFLNYALREMKKCSGSATVKLNTVLEALMSQALDGMGVG